MSELQLADVAVQIVDCEHKTAPAATMGQEYAFVVGTPNMRKGRIVLDGAKRVDRETFRVWTQRVVPDTGDLILAREAPVGEVGYIGGSQRICLGQRTVLIRPDRTRVSPRYLHYLLLGPTAQAWMQERSSGSTVPHLNVADVRQMPIGPCPSLAEQNAIAEVLGTLDDKIDANNSLEDLTYNFMQRSWEQAASGARSSVNLGDLLEVDKGLSYKGDGLGAGSPMVNLANFGKDGVFHAEGLKRYAGEAKARHWVEKNDVVLSNTDLTQRRELLGQPALVDSDEDRALFTHHVYALRFEAPDTDKLWVYAALRDHAFRDRATTFATGTTVAALPRDAVLTYEVPWLDEEGRAEWVTVAEVLVASAQMVARESSKLLALREALLPKLISGDMRVRHSPDMRVSV
jgi:type I restriction enzyme S subunit